MLSVNTNAGALIALENLNNTASQLAQAQNVVSTGLAIGSAKDNGAIWSIAQTERATVSSLDAVKSSLQTGQSIIDVANSAGTTVSNLLTQMQEKALAAFPQRRFEPLVGSGRVAVDRDREVVYAHSRHNWIERTRAQPARNRCLLARLAGCQGR